MKHVKRIASLALALVLVLALSVGVFAASGTNNDNGKITVDNAVVGQTYTIYQILELESYNEEAKAYSYKATAAWKDFIEGTGIQDTYVKVDDQGYVTWVDGASAADFAALAQAYAKAKNITNQGSTVAAAAGDAKTTTVEFTGLNLGYYLLDSSLGTLCSLNTTHTEVTIKEKNQAPTNEKKVEEDSNGELGKTNDADIGQMVKFVNEVKLPKGSQNVTFHDKMSPGLTLVEGLAGEYGLTVYTNAALTDAVVQGNYVIKAKDNADGCTVEVSFNQDYLDWQESDITLYIVYYATVNENAVVGSEGNPNESHLSYGEEGKTTTVPSKTTTYTWEIDVYKYTVVKATAEGEKDTEKALEGAVFTLSKSADGTDPIALVKVEDNVYRVAKEGESNTVTEITTDATGRFTIKGLDSDTYYLTEKTAPAGYNTLKEPVEVVIGDDGEVTYNKTSTGEVKVLNQTGAELPSTGGMGTTVFYVLGSALVLGAAVLLITRRRMRR